MFYALAQPLLLDLLGAPEGSLDATGYAVELCPTFGIGGEDRRR